jgi:uncharacterized membrane protein YedE/YeeE
MINAIVGGAIIGLAVSLMLIFNGRVTGVSGIVSGAINPKKNETSWRWFFLFGLIAGGFALNFFYPQSFIQQSSATSFDYILAGLFVGFGTLLGNGCTSGHGVCGISRFSLRSLIATITFISFGVLSVLTFKFLRGTI